MPLLPSSRQSCPGGARQPCARRKCRLGCLARAQNVIRITRGVWAWYVTGRQLTATTVARQRRLLGQVVAVSAGIGVAILAAGVVAFVLAGYNWLVLALTRAFGCLLSGLAAGGALGASVAAALFRQSQRRS